MNRKIISSFVFFILSVSLFAREIIVTSDQADKIANKIWMNEGAGLDKYLVHWNKGEEFASVGIGHFIWFTKEKPMWFFEAFPDMLKFIVKEGANPPSWLTINSKCIWNSYGDWKRAKRQKTQKYQELKKFMKETKSLQAKYMVSRLNKSFEKILNFAKSKKKKNYIKKNIDKVLYDGKNNISSHGVYILVDYLNFKGDGTLETARYQGKGWGLYQVLEYMDQKDSNPYRSFAKSANFILERLIKLSPQKRNLKRFRQGWRKRVNTYYMRRVQ